MNKIYVSQTELEHFGDFRTILKKYKKIYNFSMLADFAMFTLFGYSGVLGAFFQEYTVLALSPIFLLKAAFRFFFNTCNKRTISISSIGITLLLSVFLIFEYSIFDFFIAVAPLFGVLIYLDLKLIQGEKIKTILANVYGYSHFNELIVLNEMKDEDIFNLVRSDIKTALSENLIKKEIELKRYSALKKITNVTNIAVAVILFIGLGLFGYGNYLQKSIANPKDFTPENTTVGTYVKGEIDNIVLGAGGGVEYSYWVLYEGEYLYVVVPEKVNEPFYSWVEEDSSYETPVKFVGKIVDYESENPNPGVFKKQLPNETNAEEKINTSFAVRVLTGNEHRIFIKISGILGYISIGYMLIVLIVIIITGKKKTLTE
jgi:hypothetical protein